MAVYYEGSKFGDEGPRFLQRAERMRCERADRSKRVYDVVDLEVYWRLPLTRSVLGVFVASEPAFK